MNEPNSLPIGINTINLISSIFWCALGFGIDDWHLYVPNIVGILTSLLAIGVYFQIKSNLESRLEEEEKLVDNKP